MNGQINNYFLNSQFSMAAYAEGLFSGISDSDYRIALLDANFSESQASQFLSSYQIVDQYTDPATGFSGTVFRNGSTGEYHFAMRGTEFNELADIFADANLVINGFAGEQIISMMNYYFRLITPAGQPAIQYEPILINSPP